MFRDALVNEENVALIALRAIRLHCHVFLRARFTIRTPVETRVDALIAVLVNVQVPAGDAGSAVCAVVQVICYARGAVCGHVHAEVFAARTVFVKQLRVAVAEFYYVSIYLVAVALEPVLALQLFTLAVLYITAQRE